MSDIDAGPSAEEFAADYAHALQEQLIVVAVERDQILDLAELAWGLIANAGWSETSDDSDKTPKTPGWHEAAIRWRDDYHRWLSEHPRTEETS